MENEIRQCILNFVRNSYEATGDEGLVMLKTYVDGEKVVLEVKDNGTGILPEVYEKLGIPFVTTKPQGTGLGIPVCYRVAERHNAEIHVETSSTGTTFALKFNNL
jgi:signal transduction histidine kinase